MPKQYALGQVDSAQNGSLAKPPRSPPERPSLATNVGHKEEHAEPTATNA